MITDINKLQQDIRAIGSVSDSADFFEGSLIMARNLPCSIVLLVRLSNLMAFV